VGQEVGASRHDVVAGRSHLGAAARADALGSGQGRPLKKTENNSCRVQ
jgi:hypothetical protein